MCRLFSDWFGWSAALLGTVGALALVRPIFFLLKYREALEALIFALETKRSPNDLERHVILAKNKIAETMFARRNQWKIWAYAGLLLLVASLLPLIAQGFCLSAHG